MPGGQPWLSAVDMTAAAVDLTPSRVTTRTPQSSSGSGGWWSQWASPGARRVDSRSPISPAWDMSLLGVLVEAGSIERIANHRLPRQISSPVPAAGPPAAPRHPHNGANADLPMSILEASVGRIRGSKSAFPPASSAAATVRARRERGRHGGDAARFGDERSRPRP